MGGQARKRHNAAPPARIKPLRLVKHRGEILYVLKCTSPCPSKDKETDTAYMMQHWLRWRSSSGSITPAPDIPIVFLSRHHRHPDWPPTASLISSVRTLAAHCSAYKYRETQKHLQTHTITVDILCSNRTLAQWNAFTQIRPLHSASGQQPII